SARRARPRRPARPTPVRSLRAVCSTRYAPRVPGRLDQVAVAYSRGPVEIPWDSRDLLLAQMRPLVSMNSTIAAFEAVGASRPVTLDDDQVSLLIRVIDSRMTNVGPDGCQPASSTCAAHA